MMGVVYRKKEDVYFLNKGSLQPRSYEKVFVRSKDFRVLHYTGRPWSLFVGVDRKNVYPWWERMVYRVLRK